MNVPARLPLPASADVDVEAQDAHRRAAARFLHAAHHLRTVDRAGSLMLYGRCLNAAIEALCQTLGSDECSTDYQGICELVESQFAAEPIPDLPWSVDQLLCRAFELVDRAAEPIYDRVVPHDRFTDDDVTLAGLSAQMLFATLNRV